MMFRSYQDAASDIRKWLPHVPPISAVCGIPRSGTFVASVISQEMHVPLIPIEGLMEGDSGYYRSTVSTRRAIGGKPGRVLVVDDTCYSGNHIREVRGILGEGVLYGALYGSDQAHGVPDVCGYTLPPHHTFEWNLMRDCFAPRVLTDFDGVLCEDWGKPDDGPEWQPKYEKWLTEAKPLHRPGEFYLGGVVTARLGKYAKQSQEWLTKHGYKVSALFTTECDTPSQRTGYWGPAKHKARVYMKLRQAPVANQRPLLFIESSLHQASQIAQETHLPVVAYECMRGFNTYVPSPRFYRSERCGEF